MVSGASDSHKNSSAARATSKARTTGERLEGIEFNREPPAVAGTDHMKWLSRCRPRRSTALQGLCPKGNGRTSAGQYLLREATLSAVGTSRDLSLRKGNFRVLVQDPGRIAQRIKILSCVLPDTQHIFMETSCDSGSAITKP